MLNVKCFFLKQCKTNQPEHMLDVLMMRQTSLKAMTMVKWFQRFELKTANAQKVPEDCATNKTWSPRKDEELKLETHSIHGQYF